MIDPRQTAPALEAISFGGPHARWRTEAMRSHATARLIHISKGQGRITVAGLTNGYGPNNLIFLPPHTMYGFEVGPSVFGQMLSLPEMDDWPDTPFHLRLIDVDPQKELIALFESVERELQPSGDLRAVRCHLGLLAIFVERQLENRDPSSVDQRRQSAAGQLAARYTALITQNYSAHRSVADYAAQLNVTPTHLTRVCQKTCGRSALDLLNDRVHYAACTMLRETVTPIQAIAAELGFSSPAYFTRSFQEKAGQTPSEFRHRSSIPSHI